MHVVSSHLLSSSVSDTARLTLILSIWIEFSACLEMACWDWSKCSICGSICRHTITLFLFYTRVLTHFLSLLQRWRFLHGSGRTSASSFLSGCCFTAWVSLRPRKTHEYIQTFFNSLNPSAIQMALSFDRYSNRGKKLINYTSCNFSVLEEKKINYSCKILKIIKATQRYQLTVLGQNKWRMSLHTEHPQKEERKV